MPGVSKSPAWRDWTADPERAIDDLCARVIDGESYRSVALSLGVSHSRVRDWIDADPARAARARDARVSAARAYDEAALEGILSARDPFELAKARDAAHHLRWRASKVAPKDYGDRIDVTAEVGVRALSDEQVQAEVAVLASKLGLTVPQLKILSTDRSAT